MKQVLIMLLCLGCVVLCACANKEIPVPADEPATPDETASETPASWPELNPAADAADETVSPYASEISYWEGLNLSVEEVLAELETRCAELSAYKGILTDEEVSKFLKLVVDADIYLNENYHVDFCDEISAEEYEKWSENKFISLWSDAEGGYCYGVNNFGIRAILEGSLSEAYDEYLALMSIYHSEFWFCDGVLGMSWDKIGQYLIEWSAFLNKYAGFIERDDIYCYYIYAMYLYAGCADPEFVHAFDTWRYDDNTGEFIWLEPYTLRQDLRLSYDEFVSDAQNKDCPYYEDIAALYKTWQDSQFEYTQDVEDLISALRIKLREEGTWPRKFLF
jgi:hypothetical protein